MARTILAGVGHVEYHELQDSTAMADDFDKLRQSLNENGYLLLRGFLDRALVLSARRFIFEQLQADGLLAEGKDVIHGVCRDSSVSPRLLSRQDIAHHERVLAVLENEKIFGFFAKLLQTDKVFTASYKWLRAVARGQFTGVHMDRVYMGKGTSRLLTVWIPIGDITPQEGTLLLVPGSHVDANLARLRSEYGSGSVGKDGVASGWLTDDPSTISARFGCGELRWATTTFRAGDVCVINLDVLHMSSTNTTDRYRLSCDTRWQPAHEPVDPRIAVDVMKQQQPQQSHAEQKHERKGERPAEGKAKAKRKRSRPPTAADDSNGAASSSESPPTTSSPAAPPDSEPATASAADGHASKRCRSDHDV